MKLLISLRSPFARRARLALLRHQLPFDVEVINVFDPPRILHQGNPLALIPALELRPGFWLPDSATIIEHLHETYGQKIWPADSEMRTQVRMASTWAEGVMNATVGHFLERERANPDPEWMAEHEANIRRTLRRLSDLAKQEGRIFLSSSNEPTQAGWDAGVALEYLDLRCPSVAWRDEGPELEAVLESCRKHPAFLETAPPPA